VRNRWCCMVWLAVPPMFGSGENSGDSYGSASPADCVGVVALPTAADANALSAGFSAQWKPGSGDINNSAIDIAHAMMGKVSALS